MSNSQLQNREKVEFEELNRWQRHLNNAVWTVTSVFFTMNIIIINTIIKNWFTMQRITLLGVTISLVFIILWVVLLWFVYRLSIVTFRLNKRIADLGRNWHDFSCIFNNSPNSALKTRISFRVTIWRTNWGKLALFLSLLFIILWVVFLLLFVEVLPIKQIYTYISLPDPVL